MLSCQSRAAPFSSAPNRNCTAATRAWPAKPGQPWQHNAVPLPATRPAARPPEEGGLHQALLRAAQAQALGERQDRHCHVHAVCSAGAGLTVEFFRQ